MKLLSGASLAVGAVVAITYLSGFEIFLDRGYNDQRLFQLGFLLLVGFFWVPQFTLDFFCLAGIKRRHIWFWSAFFFLGLVSALRSWSVWHASVEVIIFFLLFLLAHFISVSVRENSRTVLSEVLVISGIGCGIYICALMMRYVSVLALGLQPNPEDLIPGFDNRRFLNHVQTITLPLLGVLVVRCKNEFEKIERPVSFSLGSLYQRKKKELWFTVCAAWWMVVFISGGRGTLIGVAVGIFVSSIWLGRRARPWCRVMVWTGFVGLAAYFFLYLLIPLTIGLDALGFFLGVPARTLSDVDSGRMALWNSALNLIVEHPWLGVGPMHFAHYGKAAGHPHNWILQITSEWGVPAFLFLLAGLAAAFREMIRAIVKLPTNDSFGEAVAAGWIAVFFSILIDGLVSGLLVMPASQLWIAVYGGCAWGWVISFSPSKRAMNLKVQLKKRSKWTHLLLAVALIGGGCACLDAPFFDKSTRVSNEGKILWPRLWLDGRF